MILAEKVQVIEIFNQDEWKDITNDVGDVTLPGDEKIDIAAIKIPQVIDVEKADEFVT